MKVIYKYIRSRDIIFKRLKTTRIRSIKSKCNFYINLINKISSLNCCRIENCAGEITRISISNEIYTISHKKSFKEVSFPLPLKISIKII